MSELELNETDRKYMREWKISTNPDLRMAQESEERFVVPEWIRRTQWRHFWADHDPVPVFTETSTRPSVNQLQWGSMLNPSRGSQRFGKSEERTPECVSRRFRRAELQIPAIYVFTVLAVLVFVSGFLLGISSPF